MKSTEGGAVLFGPSEEMPQKAGRSETETVGPGQRRPFQGRGHARAGMLQLALQGALSSGTEDHGSTCQARALVLLPLKWLGLSDVWVWGLSAGSILTKTLPGGPARAWLRRSYIDIEHPRSSQPSMPASS